MTGKNRRLIDKNIVKFASLIALVVLVSCYSTSAQVTKLNSVKLKKLMESRDLQLVDIRTKKETSRGIIPGASVIDFYSENLERELDKLDKDKLLVIYCAAGRRSAKACNMALKLGFKEVYDLTDGYNGWKRNFLAKTFEKK